MRQTVFPAEGHRIGNTTPMVYDAPTLGGNAVDNIEVVGDLGGSDDALLIQLDKANVRVMLSKAAVASIIIDAKRITKAPKK